MAQQAADVAGSIVCGSDAVYVAGALRFEATLLTLDREQRRRVHPVLATRLSVEVNL